MQQYDNIIFDELHSRLKNYGFGLVNSRQGQNINVGEIMMEWGECEIFYDNQYGIEKIKQSSIDSSIQLFNLNNVEFKEPGTLICHEFDLHIPCSKSFSDIEKVFKCLIDSIESDKYKCYFTWNTGFSTNYINMTKVAVLKVYSNFTEYSCEDSALVNLVDLILNEEF
jgi:hypothetical protein